MKANLTVAMIATPLLALTLAACGGSDDSSKPGGGNTSDGGDAAPAILKCGDFGDAIAEMAPGSVADAPNAEFHSMTGPDCHFEGTVLASAIKVDLDEETPTGNALTAGTDGWDFTNASRSGGLLWLYAEIRDGEWMACEIDQDAAGADSAKATEFCAEARDMLTDAAPQPEGW